jgi:hypothetical protein
MWNDHYDTRSLVEHLHIRLPVRFDALNWKTVGEDGTREGCNTKLCPMTAKRKTEKGAHARHEYG